MKIVNNINQPVQQEERSEENEIFVVETRRQLKKLKLGS